MVKHHGKNLLAFDYAVALVLSHLFDQFPQATSLRGMRLVIEAALDKSISDEARHLVPQVLTDTVRWLREEGFIRYESEGPTGTFRSATLTMRGLTVLGYIPVSLKASPAKEPLIEKIHKGLKAGAKTASQELIKQSVGQGFRLLLSAAS
jgi:hypothetical protein